MPHLFRGMDDLGKGEVLTNTVLFSVVNSIPENFNVLDVISLKNYMAKL